MVILIDNGHGKDTPGKRSPIWDDGSQLFEYEFNRDVAETLHHMLIMNGYDAVLLVPELNDVSLAERVERANSIYVNSFCFLVSIHANAGGGTGFEVFTSKGETDSDKIAECFVESAKEHLTDFKIRTDNSDGDQDKEAQFYILKNTWCPAILTENLFMDNERDCRYIMSREGRDKIAEMHYDAIVNYIESRSKLIK